MPEVDMGGAQNFRQSEVCFYLSLSKDSLTTKNKL